MLRQSLSRNASALLIVLAAALLAGCQTTRRAAVSTTPLAPLEAVQPRVAVQVVRAAFGEQEVTLQSVVDLDAERLQVVGLTATGQRIFTIRFNGTRVETESSPLVPTQLPAEQLLLDLQLALWPLAALERAWAGAGLEVTEPFTGTRRLRRDGRLLAEVHYSGADPWRGRLWVANFEHGYSLAVDSQLQEPATP